MGSVGQDAAFRPPARGSAPLPSSAFLPMHLNSLVHSFLSKSDAWELSKF